MILDFAHGLVPEQMQTYRIVSSPNQLQTSMCNLWKRADCSVATNKTLLESERRVLVALQTKIERQMLERVRFC